MRKRGGKADEPATVVVTAVIAAVVATLVTAVGLHADGRARAAAGALAVIAPGRGGTVCAGGLLPLCRRGKLEEEKQE